MGQDIFVYFDNNEEVHSGDYDDKTFDYFNKHSLSRTFCNLMFRRHNVSASEFEQIEKITSIDISPFYDMEKDEDGIEYFLEMAKTDEEKQKILEVAKQQKENRNGNIEKIIDTISRLINSLSLMKNLPDLLDDNGNDVLDNKIYFANFNEDKGAGYIGNNFGQDLRNFKRHLEYAKTKGATTTCFFYG
jgi:hypothetical protein